MRYSVRLPAPSPNTIGPKTVKKVTDTEPTRTLGAIGVVLAAVVLILGFSPASMSQTATARAPNGEESSQPSIDLEHESSDSEVPSNIVTSSKEGELPPHTEKETLKRRSEHRNPDRDSSGNILLDLGAKIGDMESIENNVVVVSPMADHGKLFVIHIEPGAGLKGVKVTGTYGWVPGATRETSLELLHPCVVIFDKKRFGDTEETADANSSQQYGYLRVVIHCKGDGTSTKEGGLNQNLSVVNSSLSDSASSATPRISNPVITIPISIDSKNGTLVPHADRLQVQTVNKVNGGLFSGKTITGAGVIGLKRSVKVGVIKVEVDKECDTCLVISDPNAPVDE